MSSGTERPLVSICVPSFNGRRLIDEAIDSALAQDYGRTEIVVSDDVSVDGTASHVRQKYGDQVRVFAASRRRGHQRNWNASVHLSRGELVKFLHQDDTLYENCVSQMVAALLEWPEADLVFSRRHVQVYGEAREPARYEPGERLQDRFVNLRPLNDGPLLLDQLMKVGLNENWVGEPTNVMVRRAAFERLGGFNRHVHQQTDLDLWLRLLADGPAAFIDSSLSTYSMSPASLTAANRRYRRDWLDRLWMLEGLAETPYGRMNSRVREMLRAERRMARRTVLRAALRRDPSSPPIRLWLSYLRARRLRAVFPSMATSSGLAV